MPRVTYGDDVKARVKRLFEILLSLSDLNEDNCGIEFSWDKSVSTNIKLIVKTTLRHLELLTKKDGKGHLTKTQIREALQRMEKFLEILADNRLKNRGSEEWHFTLTLWFQEPAKNLEKFEQEWENRRPKKSKQQVAPLGTSKLIDTIIDLFKKRVKQNIIETDGTGEEVKYLNILLITIQDQIVNQKILTQSLKDVIRHSPINLEEYHLVCATEWLQPHYQIDKRFVRLSLLVDQGEDSIAIRWINPYVRRSFNDLSEILEELSEYRAFVLIGSPGSGKSTLLRQLQLEMSIQSLLRNIQSVTFLVSLNNYQRSSQNLLSPSAWLKNEWEKRYSHLPSLESLLNEGCVLLLLDGLNEIPHTSADEYHTKIGLWRQFLQEIIAKGNRAFFSCRSLDYSAILSTRDLRVPLIEIQRMNSEQVQTFLQSYIPQTAGVVWESLKDTPQFDIFCTPYFLKLLVDQVEKTQTIPKNQAALFTGFIRRALLREKEANHLFQTNRLLTSSDHSKLALGRWRNEYDLPEQGTLIPSLTKLAYYMQESVEIVGSHIRINFDHALKILECEQSDEVLKAGVALGVLEHDLSDYFILFIHQLLQEYFAARELAKMPNPSLVEIEWRADFVKPNITDVIVNLGGAEPLPPLPTTGWEETTIIAAAISINPTAFITNLIEVNLPLASRCLSSLHTVVSVELTDKIRIALIDRTNNINADIRGRISAGLALGNVGDPRFERVTGLYGDYLMPPMVNIPMGIYPIGDNNSDYLEETPFHQVTLKAFKIGRFPITNAEFKLFIASGGYETAEWWQSPGAKAWLEGDTNIAQSIQRQREQNLLMYEDTIKQINLDVTLGKLLPKIGDERITAAQKHYEDFERQFKKWLTGKKRLLPDYWEDSKFNNPGQPVVGVCWYEAQAYCAWLSAQTGIIFRLPTEVEREAAARGLEAREYPYGDQFQQNLSNTFEGHVGSTTPVGVFPGGETPEGCVDLSGNIFEWTSSIFKPYPYDSTDGREDPHIFDALRVTRGGSWYRLKDHSRSAFRRKNYPFYSLYGLGFRVVFSAH